MKTQKTTSPAPNRSAKEKVEEFLTLRTRIEEILEKACKMTYKDDWDIAHNAQMMINQLNDSDAFGMSHARALFGFYLYAQKPQNKLCAGDILACFFHDIGGILREESCFLPRCMSYDKFYSRSEINKPIQIRPI